MFDRVKESVEKFTSRNRAGEEEVKELVEDIQRDLIEADVEIDLVMDLTDEIESKALESDKKSGLTQKEHVLEVVYEQLENLLGEKPSIQDGEQNILLCGLFGSGKTTTAAKLANYYRKKENKVGLICADTDRPAAYDQLKQLAEKADAQFYGEKNSEDPVRVVKNGLREIDADVKIIDSAGRDSLNTELKDELSKISEISSPDQKYLVLPADLGQSAGTQATEFDDSVDVTGVVVTKMDSTAKAGGALAACQKTGSQVKFIGNGETINDLETYEPVNFVEDMLGQPDIESLLEKVEEMDTDPEELLEGEFTLRDFQEQMNQVTDTGLMEDMMKQLPMGSQLPDNMANMTENKVSEYSAIIDSMTDTEVDDPDTVGKSRRQRIAKGSGKSTESVREMLKHYRQTRNMMDKFDKSSMERGNIQNMMQKLGL